MSKMYEQDFYFGYKDFNNPEWFKRVIEGKRRISDLTFRKIHRFEGMFNKKRFKKVISKLKSRNERIILKYNQKAKTYRLGYWKDGRGQTVLVLEVWSSDS